MYRTLLRQFYLELNLTGKLRTAQNTIINNEARNWKKYISVSALSCKRRKTDEEKVEKKGMKRLTGRKTLKYNVKSDAEMLGIWQNMTVKELADVLKKDVEHVYAALEFADKNTQTKYSPDTVIKEYHIIKDIVNISGFRYHFISNPKEEKKVDENKDAVPAPPPTPEALRPRPPVVCVMGHVDHGKTTLLDALRNTSVVETEFGGITQHIGAFQVQLSSGDTVTFLDTPGHAAFTAMRSRGALATDVVVLVVAADDGVMEQTLESIRMARDANVPMLVAINKIDKPGVNIDRTMQSLAKHGVICEELGGDVQAIQVSALKKLHLDRLVEALILQAQLMELQADPKGLVEGVVLEAKIEPQTGKQATVLVQRGTLRRGSVLVAGRGCAKVRAMSSADGQAVKEASPSVPVVVLGWREMPSAGDTVLEVESEKRANEVMKWRYQQLMKEKQEADLEVIKEKHREHQKVYMENLKKKRLLGYFKMRATGPREKMIIPDEHPALKVVVKGDVDGSVEAIVDILDTYEDHQRVRLDLVEFGVGPVTPNDLELAKAFGAIIYAFNVDCPPALAVQAKNDQIVIKRHNVIYKLIDDVKREISDRIPPSEEEEIIGEANVLQRFEVSEGRKRVPVAGARCVRGQLLRGERYRLLRAANVLYDGKLSSMKHLKDEVTTIKCDMECGLRLGDPTVDVRPGDVVVCYKMVPVTAATSWDPGF